MKEGSVTEPSTDLDGSIKKDLVDAASHPTTGDAIMSPVPNLDGFMTDDENEKSNNAKLPLPALAHPAIGDQQDPTGALCKKAVVDDADL